MMLLLRRISGLKRFGPKIFISLLGHWSLGFLMYVVRAGVAMEDSFFDEEKGSSSKKGGDEGLEIAKLGIASEISRVSIPKDYETSASKGNSTKQATVQLQVCLGNCRYNSNSFLNILYPERTYSEPQKWMRGKGLVTIQFGCCYNYAMDRDGNPPGIL